MLFLSLIFSAHAGSPTAEQCATVVHNQAAWAGQGAALEIDGQRLCALAAAGDIPKAELGKLVSCYTDEKSYASGKCSSYRSKDEVLRGTPKCAEWVRAAQGAGVDKVPAGLLCQSGTDRMEAFTQMWRCHGDPDYAVSEACADERARVAEAQEFTLFKECRDNMMGIMSAELERPTYVSLERAPRATATADAVPWVATGAWADLGWAPAGPVKGVYWVVATPETVTAHCAIDTDGDGVPAELENGLDVMFHRVTPAGVK